jgi:phosphopantothenoylcysteine decarboxylase/phosphopantothenate--cysteine ligase
MSLEWKKGRRLFLGVCGGISAYKVPEIVREFKNAGWEIEVVFSSSAEEFLSPMTVSTLSGRKVWLEKDFLSASKGWKIPHITLSEWADITIIAPATASLLHRAANGDASDLISASLLASRKPVIFFPAMNVNMWEHPAVGENVKRCRQMGYTVFDPDEGFLACGYEGKGRLPSADVIREECFRALEPKKDLKGLKILVTSGPTREAIDPVRYISNPSSGRMGSALARTSWYRGAEVTMISGPAQEPPPHGVNLIRVVSAEDMFEAVMSVADEQDIVVKAAAVGDYSPREFSARKIKRQDEQNLVIELRPNRDIAAALGASKKPGQFLVGFAAETEDAVPNALGKLERKGLDLIVVNKVGGPDGAFGSETNDVHVIGKDGIAGSFSGSKESVADAIWDVVSQKRSLPGN